MSWLSNHAEAKEGIDEFFLDAYGNGKPIAVVDKRDYDKRMRQLEVAIECLEKYRTLVIEEKSGAKTRLGKHAEDALNLMKAINEKPDSMGESK